MRHGLKRTAFARKEVVISAGAVMSPHILMHSGIGPWSQLKENKVILPQMLREAEYLHLYKR
jgi:choline dehydrogenase-like flavoprotein